ncbi:hypothetical protein ACG7TL_003561 [Trametes sanguinea]
MRSPSAASVATEFCINCDSAPDSIGAAGISRSQHMPPVAASATSPAPDASSVSTVSYSTRISRTSTPPTDVSDAPDSPPLVPIMDTAELLRRRQQSDTASAEIGKRMLRGWAMLGDECPNPNCYGIPLDEGWHGPSYTRPESHPNLEPTVPGPSASTASALEVSARSLERSLLALSARLDSLSSAPIVDPTPIGVTADTVAKVSQALTQVKQLLWSEGQARIA